MSSKSTLATAAFGICLTLAVVAAPATAHAAQPAASTQPAIPQVYSALHGGTWLGLRFTSEGYIPSQSTPGSADLDSTANAILALASSGVDASTAQAGLSYMKGHVNGFVRDGNGVDQPGDLALLILDAHALGATPTSFGGTDLVSRLLATQRKAGTDAGLFGAQDPSFDGTYRQGLSLAALAAVGMKAGTPVLRGESWLHRQQCPNGGWTSYRSSSNPCNGSPANFEGPDTNSTALAIEGLSAEGDLGSTDAANARAFLVRAQDGDGGWGYEPNTSTSPGSTDPDSTALVIQAVLALGASPTGITFDHGSANPVSALKSFQLSSGADAGAFAYPGITGADMLATYQAVPALAGRKLPFNLEVTTSSLPAGSTGVGYSATLAAKGGNAPYTWSVIGGAGALPSGLVLNSSTGSISGKPTASGTRSFTVEVTDAETSALPHTDDIAWRVLSITT